MLRRLVEVDRPLTLTELASELDTHQSSVSRIMATLVAAGYARKDEHGRFIPDYGVADLASQTGRLPLLSKPWPVFEKLAADHPQLSATVAMLWRRRLVYGLRSGGRRGIALLRQYPDYPLHRSAPGLRLLLDLPESEALDLLERSRQRHAWVGPNDILPATPKALLDAARERCVHEVLVLTDGWAIGTAQSAAIPVATPEPHPVALAIVDRDADLSVDELRLVLHTVRRDLELAFHQG